MSDTFTQGEYLSADGAIDRHEDRYHGRDD